MKSEREITAEGHWAILAALRFFLSVCVVLGHFSIFIRVDRHGIFGAGYLNPGSAVYGFFILSGYSIGASLERDQAHFYARRFLRIWPLFLSAIVFGLTTQALFAPRGFTFPVAGALPTATVVSIIASLLMLQTVISDPIPIVGQIWSLSSEWWHYMIAPQLKRLPSFALFGLVLLSLFAYLKIHGAPGRGIEGYQHGKAILVTSWFWVTGFLYYRLRNSALGVIVLILPSVFVMSLGAFIGAPLFITIFVLIASSEIAPPKRCVRPFNFLGDYSYALYLFHVPAFVAALALGSNRSAVTLGAAFLTSIFALYVVDYPSRRYFKNKHLRTVQRTTL